MTAESDRIVQLEAQVEKLRQRVADLSSRCGALMVDADRREQAAADRAEDCADHGRSLTHWQRLAEWHWAAAGQQEGARQSIVAELILLQRRARAGPLPADVLDAALGHAIDAQKKVRRRPDGWWPLETHLHLGCACQSVPVSGVACQAAQAARGRAS